MSDAQKWMQAAQVYARYAEAVDRRRWDEVGALFAPDAVQRSGRNEATGREAIVERLQGLMGRFDHPTQHTITNVVVRPTSDSAASIRADYVLLAQKDGQVAPLAIGSYEGELAWTGTEWVLVKQSMVPAQQP